MTKKKDPSPGILTTQDKLLIAAARKACESGKDGLFVPIAVGAANLRMAFYSVRAKLRRLDGTAAGDSVGMKALDELTFRLVPGGLQLVMTCYSAGFGELAEMLGGLEAAVEAGTSDEEKARLERLKFLEAEAPKTDATLQILKKYGQRE